MGREVTLKSRILLWISAHLDLGLAKLQVSKNVPHCTKLSSSLWNVSSPQYEIGDMLRQSWFISLAFLSLSARFPASWAGHVSSLFKSGGFLYPCLSAGGQRGRGRGSRWGMVPSTCLPLKTSTCLCSRLCSSTWELGDFSEKWWSG